jgi:hypothetical protein
LAIVAVAAAFVAWLGAALVVLSDGRRGLSLGLALITAGFAVLALSSGIYLGAAAVAAGGLIGSWQYLRSGPPTWVIMPAGSTARLVLCIASGLVALWVAALVTTGPGAPLRFAVLVVLGLMGARILASGEISIVLTGIAAFALALAAAPGLTGTSQGDVPDIVGGLVAAGVMFIPPAVQPQGAPRPDKRGT